ncbi:hypothetical protein [Arthrobacter sp. UM1]|uniref:hypothetical protein n=1 Tax=Arthrobacter sp. UM1 TaxID=2766776 RepID=UPI001CF6E33A|nr:hypothetical protein [Arthrobacter sp. UM1]MCB4209086.1 hypothetical protein [Arthrobacter sp. UM1]
MSNISPKTRRRASWMVPAALGTTALAASLFTGSLGAYTASITNSNNTAGAGSLVMQETGKDSSGNAVTCTSTDGTNNAATCATINKYGGNTAMSPGQSVSTQIALKNTGSVNATGATLTPGQCTNNPTNIDLCSQMQIVITENGNQIWSGTAAALAAKGPITLTAPNAGTTNNYQITTTLPASATTASAGGTISQPLTWTYTA